MHPQWARELRDAVLDFHALDGRPAFHFKQQGSYVPDAFGPDVFVGHDGRTIRDRMVLDARPDMLVDPVVSMRYVGPSPKAGGNRLDGQEWLEFPRTQLATF
jgi:protein gp37